MRSFFATTTLLSLLAVAPVAVADTGEEPLARTKLVQPPAPKEWYGWQILATDTATFATTYVLANLAPHGDYAAMNLYGGYLLGGPIVHGVHGNYGASATSLGLRLALPIGGGLIGCNAYGDREELFGCLPGAVVGVLIGAAGATALDASVLGYADAKPRPKAFEVLPSASVSKTGATFGLQGMF